MFKVMFLCTGNSCRSQMAEGIAKKLGAGLIESFSAGLVPTGINRYAVKVMKKIGIDISGQQSKPINENLLRQMDTIITLCGNAELLCPATPPEIKHIHWPIDDPAKTVGSEEEILKEFTRTRDEIKGKIEKFLMEAINAHNNS
ncbi:MAG: arsenate reductase ArsC [Epsilonproteobacteria bacterium]|nr:arsenate reductase ArsC [Campylobacterota bacterium]